MARMTRLLAVITLGLEEIIGGFSVNLTPIISTMNGLWGRDVRVTRSSLAPDLNELVLHFLLSFFVPSSNVTAGNVTGDSGHRNRRGEKQLDVSSSCPKLSSRKRRWWYVLPFHLRTLFVN